MKKILAILISGLFLSISCSSLPCKKDKNENQKIKESFAVVWNTKYIPPTDKDGHLVITNPETGKSFKISYKDFFIMKKAYKNWRLVEKSSPVITSIQQNGEKIYVIFNYLDGDGLSVLSGRFIVDLKYIKKQSDEKTKTYLKAGLISSGVLNIALAVIIAIIL